MAINVLLSARRLRQSYPAGESAAAPVQLRFERRLNLEFHGSNITLDARLLAYRELDAALALDELANLDARNIEMLVVR